MSDSHSRISIAVITRMKEPLPGNIIKWRAPKRKKKKRPSGHRDDQRGFKVRGVTEDKTVFDLKRIDFYLWMFLEKAVNVDIKHHVCVCVCVNELRKDGFAATMDRSAGKEHTIP